MIKNKIFSLLVIIITFFGVVMPWTNSNVFSAQCPENPDDWSCESDTCPNGGVNPPTCSCPEDEWNGMCVPGCSEGQSRNANGSCESDTCPNGGVNPPTCSCPEDEWNGMCVPGCSEGQSRNANGVCEDLQCEPPQAGDYPACDSCVTGYEMCDGTCYESCPAGQSRTTDNGCICYPNSNGCCADSTAKNFDSSCPDGSAVPPTYEDNSGVCEYCQSGSTEPQCTVSYCSELRATNFQTEADCEMANPNKNCVANDLICTYPDLYYCDDQDALFPPSTSAQDCELNRQSSQQKCLPDPSYCTYPTNYYCNDDRAGNYDENGDQCKASNPKATCEPDNDECAYSYCSVSFLLDINCPSGFTGDSPYSFSYSYQYSPFSPYYETCVSPTAEEVTYLENYFEQVMCGETASPVCTGDFCSQIDWCVADDGIQTSPADCTDVCPNIDGVQSVGTACGDDDLCANLPGLQTTIPVGYGLTGGDCMPQTDGMCGTLDNGSASSASVITGTNACTSGTRSSISYSNGQFEWQCLGVEGGQSDSCDATISCGSGSYYCEQSDSCKPLAETCGPPNTCVNQNLCVFNGNVSLDEKLKVTPLVERDGTCTIDVGASTGVFDSFSTITHCVITNQTSVIATFDPINLTTPLSVLFQQTNIQRDMNYTLKCYDGAFDGTYDDEAYGSCWLNLNSKEFN